MPFICCYLLIVNALGILFMHMDKKRARTNRLRLPEVLLLGTAVIGGSIGIFLGMLLFRHKTRHLKFVLSLPLLLLLQAALCLLFLI